MYLSRWRIETYHRSIKTEYSYEDMRVRNLKAINNLTYLFNLVIAHIVSLIEEISLLSIKIMEESKSLRQNVGVWITQFAVGINKMLRRSVVGIKGYFKGSKKKINNEILGTQLSLQL